MFKKLLMISVWYFTSSLLVFLALGIYYKLNYQIKDGSFLLNQTASQLAYANELTVYSSIPRVLGSFTTAIKTGDARPEIIENYLCGRNSPYCHLADLMVKVADENGGYDPRLLVAIGECESNSGRKIPDGTFNAWGYGIHSRGTLGFESWEEAIKTVGKGLYQKFILKIMKENNFTSVDQVTPEALMEYYTPHSLSIGGPWARCVRGFMDIIK